MATVPLLATITSLGDGEFEARLNCNVPAEISLDFPSDTASFTFEYDSHVRVHEMLVRNGISIDLQCSYEDEQPPEGFRSAVVDSYEEADAAVEAGKSALVLGGGGNGKSTFVIKHAVRALEVLGLCVWVCALTGPAAKNLTAGLAAAASSAKNALKAVTLHAALGIHPGDEHGTYASVRAAKAARRRAYVAKCKREHRPAMPEQTPDMLVIDEIGMMNPALGGLVRFLYPDVQVLGSGDFFQLPPIQGDGPKVAGQYLFESEPVLRGLFGLNIFEFNVNFRMRAALSRAVDDADRADRERAVAEWLAMIDHLREDGTLLPEHIDLLKTRSPLREDVTDSHVSVCRTNREVDEINSERLEELGAPKVELPVRVRRTRTDRRTAAEDVAPEEGAAPQRRQRTFEVEVATPDLEVWIAAAVEEHSGFMVAVGARVIMTRNIDVKAGLVNGSIGTVRAINEETGEMTVDFDGPEPGKEVRKKIPLKEVASGVDKGRERIYAFSLHGAIFRLAWALTVHRVLGLTIPKLTASLDGMHKQPGLLYVLLSRLSDPAGGVFADAESLRDQSFADPLVIEFHNVTLPEIVLQRREQAARALPEPATYTAGAFYRGVPGYEPHTAAKYPTSYAATRFFHDFRHVHLNRAKRRRIGTDP
jgi:hypothetical protein